MEMSVQAVETSEIMISMKESCNGKSKDLAVCFSGDKKCNDERKDSENDRSFSIKPNEYSLVRKMSFKELRKSVEEVEDEPNLTSRQGKVSLVVPDDLQYELQKEVPTTKRDEERKQQEVNVKEEPAILHLSQIKIQQWANKVKASQNDEEKLGRIKQVCGSMEDDDFYHYVNVDDFDDINESYQTTKWTHFRKSRKLGPAKQIIRCKYEFGKKGMIFTGVPCKGSSTKDTDSDMYMYCLARIASRQNTIQCIREGCTNFYDPREVVEVLKHVAGDAWLKEIAIDPLKTPKNIVVHREMYKRRSHLKKGPKPYWMLKARKSESNDQENCFNRKPKNKIKLLKLLKPYNARRTLVSETSPENSARNEVQADKDLLKHGYVCSICREGFSADELITGLNCGHFTCRPCLFSHFKRQLCLSNSDMRCPCRGCSQKFDKSFILIILNTYTFQSHYMKLYNERKEMGNENEMSKSDETIETCQDCEEHATKLYGKDYRKKVLKPKVTKTLRTEKDSSLKWSNDNKRCPGCLIRLPIKLEDEDSYNIVRCGVCRTKFCWICGRKDVHVFHMYQCPMFGGKKFGKRRRIGNYVGYTVGLAVGVPVVGALVIGMYRHTSRNTAQLGGQNSRFQ